MELKLAGFPRVWGLLSREICGVHLEIMGAGGLFFLHGLKSK